MKGRFLAAFLLAAATVPCALVARPPVALAVSSPLFLKSPALHLTAPESANAGASTLTKQITAYEQKFFERSFDGESDARRLDRLDTFIFGAVGTGSPQARLNMISKVVQSNTPSPEAPPPPSKPKPTQQVQSLDANGQAPQAQSHESNLDSPGNYPHITALEAKILGQTYTSDGISTRLTRLETKAFGQPSKSKDLEDRTDAIDRYMRAKLKPNDLTIGAPLEEDAEDPVPDNLASLRKEMADARASHFGSPTGDPTRYRGPGSFYERADEDPGAIVRHQTIQQELADAQRTTPPSKDERTLSRIAWCEQQVFGHAFPEMHLLKRLHQLNHELFPQDKEPDIQLMDRIDNIVKEVVLRKQPHQPTQT